MTVHPGAPITTILDAEVDGVRVDVRVEGSSVTAVAAGLPAAGTRTVHAGGGALLPGLHDHHLHLLAMAAAASSVDAGAPGVTGAADFDRWLRAAHAQQPTGEWLRVVGWDERHGPLDRHRLDLLAPGRPVRVQHRSGAAWVLSSAALRAIGLEHEAYPGVERDEHGRATGVLHRLDTLLAERLPPTAPPDLAPVGRRLASYGVTGVTDATPYEHPGGIELLAAARRAGALPQRVLVTGGLGLVDLEPPPELERGPVKVVVADNDLPSVESLVAAYRAARRAGRAVAVHCVTRVGLVLALAAWEQVPAIDGDRIEHGSVLPVELMTRVRELGLRVVTQPGFVLARGDRYLAEVEADDQPHLYRCASLLDAGIPVAGSTDAPFGPDDPWQAVRTAIDRRTAGGAVLGAHEALDPARSLGLFLSAPDRPGGPARRVAAGAAADLCLLDRPLSGSLAEPGGSLVRACWIDGLLVTGDS